MGGAVLLIHFYSVSMVYRFPLAVLTTRSPIDLARTASSIQIKARHRSLPVLSLSHPVESHEHMPDTDQQHPFSPSSISIRARYVRNTHSLI
jgi:hypothetical protein